MQLILAASHSAVTLTCHC